MKGLIFTGDRDSPGKRDYSTVFAPEAKRFAEVAHIDYYRVVAIDTSEPLRKRTERVLFALTSNGPLDVVAFFCHGYPRGLQLVGDYVERYKNEDGETKLRVVAKPATVNALGAAISKNTLQAGMVRVALYACSAGDVAGPGEDGCFADSLRDALCASGSRDCQVDAHTTAGHATRNPHVRRFLGDGSPVGGTGGSWIVSPGSKLWHPWRKALRGDMRLRFPLLSSAAIHEELLGTEAVA